MGRRRQRVWYGSGPGTEVGVSCTDAWARGGYESGLNPPAGERKLYLLIEGDAERKVPLPYARGCRLLRHVLYAATPCPLSPRHRPLAPTSRAVGCYPPRRRLLGRACYPLRQRLLGQTVPPLFGDEHKVPAPYAVSAIPYAIGR
eukprot:3742174-Rhodomonas_salina.1